MRIVRLVSARLAVALFVLALVAVPASTQSPDCTGAAVFSVQTASPVGSTQRHAEAADLNGDEVPDLVISTDTGLIIALGSLAPGNTVNYPATFTFGGIPSASGTAIADFDGDAIKDIAVASYMFGGGLHLLRGLGSNGVGNGQFVQYQTISTDAVWDVAAADLNADGILDLVTGNSDGHIISYLGSGSAGTGDGSFVAAGNVQAPLSCKGLVLADLDLDGILDVVVAGENALVGVLHGNGSDGVGNGTFAVASTLTAGGSTYDVAVADFNRDGIPDIATANYTGQSVSVLLGGPAFTFQAPIVHDAPGNPLGIAAADFDNDGFVDLVATASGSSSSFTYFRNTGTVSSTLDGFGAFFSIGPARVGYGITAAPLNLDSSMDVLMPDISQNSIFSALDQCGSDRPRVLTVVVSGSGTVVRQPDQPDYPIGTVVQLTAAPASGWVFSHWSGALTGSQNPTSITMDVDHGVGAMFVAIQQTLTITLTGPGHGTVARSPSLPTYNLGSTVTLTAVPELGSLFTGWSGDVTGTTNPVNLLMDGDKSVTATFGVDETLPPHILSVTDVPLDQGGKVKLRWSASSLESTTTDPIFKITQYFIWREIPQAAFAARSASSGEAAAPAYRTATDAREYFWEFVTSLPASRFAGYSYTAVTTSDSTELGNPFTSFLVQARNAAATRWFDSDPDSGYSVDNLAPTTPGPFVASYGASGNSFHWGPSRAPDLRSYRIYRGPTASFVPDAGNLIGAPTDTVFVDPTPTPSYYRLAAADIHGNLSHFVLVSPETPVATLVSIVSSESWADRIAITWFLSQNGMPAAVYRRAPGADWRLVSQRYADGQGYLRYEDHTVSRGERYDYRLGIQDGGQETFLGEVSVLAEELRFALDGVVPNPSSGERLTVQLVLPSASPGTLELVDVTGRRLAMRRLQGQAGRQAIALDPAARLAPGLYWVRLRHSGLERSVRAVVMR